MSELKWQGLRPGELRKHGLRKSGRHIIELLYDGLKTSSASFPIDGDSCHLCKLYSDGIPVCEECPITLYVREAGIVTTREESCGVEYLTWVKDGDPEPMIKLLKDARSNWDNRGWYVKTTEEKVEHDQI